MFRFNSIYPQYKTVFTWEKYTNIQMKYSDLIITFMEKAIGNPDKYDCFIYSNDTNFWGCTVTNYINIDPNYRFDQYLLLKSSPSFVFQKKGTQFHDYDPKKYKKNIIDPMILQGLNEFNEDIINDTFELINFYNFRRFFSLYPISDFFSSGIDHSLVKYIGFNEGSFCFFTHDMPVFYSSAMGLVYYKFDSHNRYYFVFKNGNSFINLKFSSENGIQEQILSTIEKGICVGSNYQKTLTKLSNFNDPPVLDLPINYSSFSNVRRISNRQFISSGYIISIEPNCLRYAKIFRDEEIENLTKELKMNDGAIYCAFLLDQNQIFHIYGHDSQRKLYHHKWGANNDNIFETKSIPKKSDCKIIDIRIIPNSQVFVLTNKGLRICDCNLNLIAETDHQNNMEFVLADASYCGNNIVVADYWSRICFYRSTNPQEYNYDLSLLPPSVRILDLNISQSSRWLLVTTSYFICLIDCLINNYNCFSVKPPNITPKHYYFTIPIDFLSEFDYRVSFAHSHHLSQSKLVNDQDWVYIISVISDRVLVWRFLEEKPNDFTFKFSQPFPSNIERIDIVYTNNQPQIFFMCHEQIIEIKHPTMFFN